MFITLNTVLSKIVYMTVSKTDCENAMTLNEQIMTRIDQYFEELERFTLVVANDEMLNVLIETYNKEPTNANESKIRLYLSGLGIRDKIQSYAVLGIYANVQNSKKELHFTTVGLSASLKNYVQNTIPTISLDNTTGKFIDPFTYDGDSTTVFGNKFNMAYGFISPYSVNQMQGSVTVIASFDQIIYIAENMKDYSHDYLLLDNQNEAIKPSVENSKIDITKALSHLTYGKSYKEGFFKEKDAITTVRYSDYGEWKLVCRLTRADILKNNSSLILLDQILVAVFGICVVLIMIPLVQKFTRPLSKVSEQMGEIARGNLKARVVVKSEDEIAEVGRAFNIMAKKLQENIDKMLEQEKREQKMRYSLMISQVDP
ncbi:hypothetical protein CG709_20750, partial [Lachnotalea glycerini]